MKKLDILIACANDDLFSIDELLQAQRENIRYVICHQIFEQNEQKKYVVPRREDVFYYQTNSIGLSKNRNDCLENVEGDVAIIADSDVKYFDNSYDEVLRSHEESPEADIIVFQVDTLDSNKPFRDYRKDPFWLKESDLPNVSSIEISFKTKSIMQNNIKFNENFGLGATIISGEENLFLLEALNSGLKIKYVPKKIVYHPYETSTRNDEDNYSLARIRTRAANARIHYQNKHFIYYPYYMLKYRKQYRKYHSYKDVFKSLMLGKKIAEEEYINKIK